MIGYTGCSVLDGIPIKAASMNGVIVVGDGRYGLTSLRNRLSYSIMFWGSLLYIGVAGDGEPIVDTVDAESNLRSGGVRGDEEFELDLE